ncbi:MAG: Ubiquinone/menaquinone biosynthesis C-methyltransferase UbiE [Candidatus Heimdallarchaeota archaeon LC_3]|nr:MAG: Ubiquinone/menaquinone biosynthesis C-methyltransferase UbiE [Candidatus Heimdallarchaeota archaeon LC_3]
MDESNDFISKKKEKALYISSSYTGEVKPVNLDKMDQSAKLHIEKIKETRAESVLDFGCGTGGILLALQQAGVKEIHGIDASPEAIEMIKKRFEKYGTLEKTSFTAGDILQFDPPVVDVVSSHFVLCCHPNAIGMVDKATEKYPKIIVISFPNDNILTKTGAVFANIILWISGLFKRSNRGLRWYAHSTKKINVKFEENGYRQIFIEKSFINQTLIYEKVK